MEENAFSHLLPNGQGSTESAPQENAFEYLLNKQPNSKFDSSSYVGQALGSMEAFMMGGKRAIESAAEGFIQTSLQGLSAAGFDVSDYSKRLENMRAERLKEIAPYEAEHPYATAAGNIASNVVMAAPVSIAAPMTVPAQAAAAGIQTAVTHYGAPEEKLKSGLVSGVVAGGLTGIANAPKNMFPNADEAAANYAAAEQANVPLTVGQAGGSPTVQAVESKLKDVPVVGMKAAAQVQDDAVKAAVKDFSTNITGDAVEAGSRTELGKSIMTSYTKNKEAASKLYEDFGKKAAQLGDNVPANNLKDTALKMLEAEAAQPGQIPQKLIPALQKIQEMDSLPNGVLRNGDSALHEYYKGLSRIGDNLGKAEGPAGSKLIEELKSAYLKDLDTFAQNKGGAFASDLAKANAFYKDKVIAMKDHPAIKDFLASGGQNTDKLATAILKKDSPDMMRSLMENLDEAGKGQVRSALVKKAVEDSMKDGALDPKTFISKLAAYKDTVKETLTRPQLAELEGLKKVVELTTSGARELKVHGIEPESIISILGLASLVHNPVATGIGGVATSAASSILSNPKVGKWLLNVSRKPNHSASLINAVTSGLASSIFDVQKPDQGIQYPE